jgi:hypothetical protein
MIRRPVTYLAVIAAVGLVAGFGGGFAWATIPAGNTIHGCYKKDTGVLRVIDTSAGDSCNPKSETALDWSQTGQQGIQGIQGIGGQQGATGSAGTDGVSAYQIETATGTTAYDSFWTTNVATVNASCPDGTIRTGVGFDLPSTKISPFAIGGDLGELLVIGDAGLTATVYTVCVDQQFKGE